MYQIRCRNCGAHEGEEIHAEKELRSSETPKRNGTLSDRLTTEFRCDSCGMTERVDVGILPELEAQHFDSIWIDQSCESTTVEIDGKQVEFESIDEQITENSHYTPEGIRSTSKIHHLHVHALDAPTFSKGKHDVKIDDFVDDEFILSTVRYHEKSRRTLKFYRSIPTERPEPISSSPAPLADPELPR